VAENLSENSLKGDLSNANTFNPPLFSLVNTFKGVTGRILELVSKKDKKFKIKLIKNV
jgi:hypothetical protein